MTSIPPVEGSLQLAHGMEHAGLAPAALSIERSPEFKRAFVETISRSLSLEEGVLELAGPDYEGLDAFLASFGPDGHPPEEEVRAFLDPLLSARAGTKITTGPMLRDCCIRWLGGWKSCSGFALERDGEAWTIGEVVDRYESGAGTIGDRAVRDALAGLRVYAELGWVVPL